MRPHTHEANTSYGDMQYLVMFCNNLETSDQNSGDSDVDFHAQICDCVYAVVIVLRRRGKIFIP